METSQRNLWKENVMKNYRFKRTESWKLNSTVIWVGWNCNQILIGYSILISKWHCDTSTDWNPINASLWSRQDLAVGWPCTDGQKVTHTTEPVHMWSVAKLLNTTGRPGRHTTTRRWLTATTVTSTFNALHKQKYYSFPADKYHWQTWTKTKQTWCRFVDGEERWTGTYEIWIQLLGWDQTVRLIHSVRWELQHWLWYL